MNVTLHPTLARDISLAIIKRSSAGEAITLMTTTATPATWDQNKFLFMVAEHQKATAVLKRYGIDLATYDLGGANKESTQ